MKSTRPLSVAPRLCAIAVLAAAIGLSGCETPNGAGSPSATSSGAAVSAPGGNNGAAAPGAADGAQSVAVNADTQQAAIIRFDPAEFIGKGPDGLLPMLGAPDFVRRDGIAQVWQYRSEACILDLFLYREGPHIRVEHAELRNRDSAAETADACYTRLRSERGAGTAG